MKKILIVDDDAAIRQMLELRLGLAGYALFFAQNGEVGVREALLIQPDLILMDMHMPVMDGHTAVRTLRQQNYTGIIAALTASALVHDGNQAFAAGCNYFISKPIMDGFEDLIESILKGVIP